MTGNGSKTLRRYHVKTEGDRWLATVIISDDGYFSTVSDWGSYAYWWSAAGDCFRSFLTRINPDYLLGKIAPQQSYDGPATCKTVKRHILDMRRDGDIGRDTARQEWEFLRENNWLDNREDFAYWIRDTEIEEPWTFAEQSHDSDAVGFAEKAWPRIQAVIRAELEAERNAA